MSGFLVINPRSGDSDPSDEELRDQARRRGIETHTLAPEDDPSEVARGAPAGALGMAGGDGSLAAVAEVAIERDVPFVAVPFGTRNHFARDIGLDRDDPLAALAAFEGSEQRVDVGRVNERLFLNNVSLGLYARLVHRREGHRRRRDAFARLRALGLFLQHPGSLGVKVDGRPAHARIVLVANNAYQLELLSIGERDRLDEGKLYLYVDPRLASRGPGRSNAARRSRSTRERGALQAAIDGEPEELETPLRFEIEPAALRVLLPPG